MTVSQYFLTSNTIQKMTLTSTHSGHIWALTHTYTQIVFPPWTRSAFVLAVFSWQSLDMNFQALEKRIELLTILVDGCKKHPAYRAIRPATGRCKPCVKMWEARLSLQELDK